MSDDGRECFFTRGELEKRELRGRAITRDMEWGVPIPLDGYDDKRLYVWFEAVTGYLSAPQELLPQGWEPYWRASAEPKAYYFLGKDNIPFHTIIWQAELLGIDGIYNEANPEQRLQLPYDVPANETVVQALQPHGIEILTSCEQGVCGTCITRVLEGECDHRDLYFTDEEKAANDQFTPCCSRAKSPLLVLDL